MSLLSAVHRFLFSASTTSTPAQLPKFILTSACLEALTTGLRPSLQRQHEGVAYLLGRTDRFIGLATTVFVPTARTTRGSFFVEPRAMVACMNAAASHELQIVAQVHTHPGLAYHSDGDEEGAKIRYPGYASIVLPNYGAYLPRLDEAAAFVWTQEGRWAELTAADLVVIPGAGPWTKNSG